MLGGVGQCSYLAYAIFLLPMANMGCFSYLDTPYEYRPIGICTAVIEPGKMVHDSVLKAVKGMLEHEMDHKANREDSACMGDGFTMSLLQMGSNSPMFPLAHKYVMEAKDWHWGHDTVFMLPFLSWLPQDEESATSSCGHVLGRRTPLLLSRGLVVLWSCGLVVLWSCGLVWSCATHRAHRHSETHW